MLQGERLKEVEKVLSQIWEEMQLGYVDDTSTFLQEAVNCQVNIDRIVFIGNKYRDRDFFLENREEYSYRNPTPNRYIKVSDCGSKMFRCPQCGCGISAVPFSYAVGDRGYSFCPYCGKDVRKDAK